MLLAIIYCAKPVMGSYNYSYSLLTTWSIVSWLSWLSHTKKTIVITVISSVLEQSMPTFLVDTCVSRMCPTHTRPRTQNKLSTLSRAPRPFLGYLVSFQRMRSRATIILIFRPGGDLHILLLPVPNLALALGGGGLDGGYGVHTKYTMKSGRAAG